MESTLKQMWSKKEAELIELWQQREYLYDIASKDYHNRSKKQQAWREISEELQIPIGEIITRIASLRTQYGKLIHPKPGGRADKILTPRQKWIVKHLEFLKCHVLPRASLSTIECETTGGDEEQEQEWAEDTDSFTSSTSSSLESNDITTTPTHTLSTLQHLARRQTSQTKTTTVESDHNIEREKISLLKHAINNAIKTEDSDDNFGKLVASKMHQITDPLEKLHVEQSITNILYAALNTSMPSQKRQSDSSAEIEKGSKEEVVCDKHSEVPFWFCEDEQRAVCPVCEFSLHQSHKVVPVQQAVSERKEQLKSDLKSLQEERNKYRQVEKTYSDMNEHVKNQVSATERQIRAEFNKLHQFLKKEEESRLAALREEEEQKGKTISREMKRIQEKISSLSDRISAVEEELKKDMPFLSSYKYTQTRTQSSPSDPQLVSGALIDVAKHLGNLSFRVWDKIKDKVKFGPVILDPNNASGWLHLSDDLTSVRCGDTEQQLPDNPGRNTGYADVFGSEGFSSGKHSWEVEVGHPPDWNVGLVKESVDRFVKTEASPEYGHW